MGQLVSAFLGESEGVHEAETLESLRILQKLVATKLEAYAQKMEAEAFEDKSLPIIAVVDKTEKYLVKVENAPSEEIKKTLDDLFEGEFLDGLHNLVSAALNELLGNTAAGEKEKRECHVVYANNNLLRVDYHMYKYDFSSKGLRDKMQNALCCVVHIAVLDLNKVDPQVVLYELDKSIGTGNIQAATDKLHEEAKYMEELYKVINHLRVASIKSSLPEKAVHEAALREPDSSNKNVPQVVLYGQNKFIGTGNYHAATDKLHEEAKHGMVKRVNTEFFDHLRLARPCRRKVVHEAALQESDSSDENDPQVVLYERDKAIGTGNIQAATEKLHEEAKYGMEERLYTEDEWESGCTESFLPFFPANEAAIRYPKPDTEVEPILSDEDDSQDDLYDPEKSICTGNTQAATGKLDKEAEYTKELYAKVVNQINSDLRVSSTESSLLEEDALLNLLF